MPSTHDRKRLEDMIDRSSIEDVINAIAFIAAEKEDHIIHNWQDRATARAWGRAVTILERAASQIEV